MKKKLLYSITVVLLLISCTCSAQWQNGLWTEKQAYNWYFCMNAGLNFSQTPPLPLDNGNVASITSYQTDENGVNNPDTAYEAVAGSSVMSDSEGNLLFYTDGNTVWNKNHQVMVNGTDLICGPWGKQNNIIVPAPGHPDRYFIFSIKEPGYYTLPYPFPIPNPLYSWRVVYSEVDMSLDNGMGGVTVNKNVILGGIDEPTFLAGSYYARISATYHSDEHQIWVMTHGIGNNEFRAFLVSDTGVNMTPVISSVGVSYDGYPDTMAQMKFSPDGTKVVKSLMLYDEGKNVEVFNFDKSTGEVTGLLVTIGQQEFINEGELAGAQGLEFSPNSKLLYTTGITSGVLKQFNLDAGDEASIRASGIALSGSEDPLQFNHYMQVGPDGKIYIAYSEEAYGGFGSPMSLSTINVVNFPNNVGVSSGFTPNAIDLGSGKSAHSFPSFIQDYFASGILYEGDCEGTATTFSTIRIPGITGITWNFGDPDSGGDNTSLEPAPSHTFSGAGTYTVTAVITSNNAQQTATKIVTILPAPIATMPLSTDLRQCADASGKGTFNLSDLDESILDGQSATDYIVTYYASIEDMESGTVISMPDEFVTSGQSIFAMVTNTVTGCRSVIELVLVVNSVPVTGNPSTIQECGNASSTAVFDLTQQIATVLGNLNPVEYSVTFYTDPEVTNQVQQPATFTSQGQIIYSRITNLATGCSVLAQFDILVLPQPSLPDTSTFEGCSPFDLVIIAGEPESGTVFSFYTTEEDALGNVNAIVNTNNYVLKDNMGTLYVRAQDASGCVQVGQLLIESGDCSIPRGISPNGDGMNDTFDLSGFDVKLLMIYNRYGQEVYSRENYMNEWLGQSSNGNELPSATYFYIIEYRNGNSKTGWVYVNRQE